MQTLNVGIIGCGYVGLVTGTCLANEGHNVNCLDVDPNKIKQVQSGKAPFFEDGLNKLIECNINKSLHASTNMKKLNDADLILVCVGTPFDGKNIDLTYVLSAAEEIGLILKNCNKYIVVAIKSTVIPGTTTGIFKNTLEQVSGKKAGEDFGLGMNPEFLAEGSAIQDFINPDRIVVGGIDDRSTDMLADLYHSFDDGLIMRTNPSTAEMIKYTSNSLLATLISFSNEIASYCDLVEDVDVTDVLQGVHKMQHLNYENENGERFPVSAQSFLWAGCGFGGSCFPKDVKALTAFAEKNGKKTNLLKSVLEINELQPYQLIDLMTQRREIESIKKITILGMAFKPGTDDIRESPSLKLTKRLVEMGKSICCHDPIANENAKFALESMQVNLENVTFTNELDEALTNTNVVMLITSWPEYLDVPEKLNQLNDNILLVDGRRFFSSSSYTHYCGIGN